MTIRFLTCLLVSAILLPSGARAVVGAESFDTLMERVAAMQEAGRLADADETVLAAIAESGDSLTPGQKRALEYEIERSRRIRLDYSVTEEELIELLAKSVRDFTPEEFRQWEAEGRFDHKLIDGEKRYVGASRSNLFFRYPDARARRIGASGDSGWERFIWAEYQRVKSEFRQASQGTLAPRRFECHLAITVKPDIVEKGRMIRCWMPFPQQFAAQGGVELLETNPPVKWINSPDYPMRSLYFEQPSRGAEPTAFEARWRMDVLPRHYPIDPAKVTAPAPQVAKALEAYTDEHPPHIVFTDEIRRMAEEIAGGETNPYLRAKKYYDWISENISYSYAREYSTLRNISMYVAENGYGDCGQITLLFMALCRAGGIPARWESGWMLYPVLTNLHDWCEIYIEPYGWIPVDANYGVDISRGFAFLSDEEREELRNYYFGGLDAYRLVANKLHGYPHYPPKVDFRSDDVDFQRGELEADGKNIYFGDFRYRMNVEYLSPLPDYAALEEKDTAAPQQAGPTAPGLAR